jgi:hypothetical protein
MPSLVEADGIRMEEEEQEEEEELLVRLVVPVLVLLAVLSLDRCTLVDILGIGNRRLLSFSINFFLHLRECLRVHLFRL